MSDFSLRLPYLIYLAIGSMLVGVLIAPAFRDMPEETAAPEMAAMMEGMPHATRDVPAATAPQLTMTVREDPMDGWNISLQVENFTFAPGSVGQSDAPNTGHAHLYVNGVKTARLYGPDFHLPTLTPGQHEITVNLSSNDHAHYTVDGNPIAARAMIMQGDPIIPDA